MERLCALYGYRRIQTPVFEDTELFARTSGAGSDIVQKEMYTFTDRSDRSLTLRPEGTAPICRAYIEHGLHKEPQPQKLYTIGSMYRYGRPGSRPLQRALAALGRGDRHRRPGDRRRDHPALRHAPAPARHHGVPAGAELDRLPRVPARVPREAARLARRARGRARRGRTGEGGDEPAARLRRQEPGDEEAARGRPQDRRVALRRVRRALRRRPRRPRRDGRRLRARADARARASTTTRARPGSSSGRWTTRTRPSPAAAATTTSSRRSAARRRRAWASARGSSGC